MSRVAIEKVGNRIQIHADGPSPGLNTTIPGAYQTVAGYWTVPLSMESCRLLREHFGRRLHIGKQLNRWAKGVLDAREYMSTLAASEDAELDNLEKAAPALYAAMDKRTYQRVGARFIADNVATLVADDPGLGKTLIAMGGILEAGVPGPYLVVAPKTAADSVWRREILRWLPKGHRPIILPELRPKREYKLATTRYGDRTWLIVHPEITMVDAWWECTERVEIEMQPYSAHLDLWKECGHITRETVKQKTMLDCGHKRTKKTRHVIRESYPKLFEIEWGAIVIDESHESLIRRGSAITQRRRGMDMLKLRGDGIKIAMSGTPTDSKPHQLWGTLNWLDPKTYSAYGRWAELYWARGGYTGFQLGEFRVDREQMLWDSLSTIALRRTKAEVAKDLPPKVYVGSPLDPYDEESPVGVWLPMEPKQAIAYRQMEELSYAELESGRLQAITALAALTRLKQMATCYGDIETRDCWQVDKETGERWYGPKDFYVPRLPSNKFDWVIDSLEEWGYPYDPITKVVIVSFYTGILEAVREGIEQHFAKELRGKKLCTAITGRTKIGDRRAIIDRFNQPGGPRIMLLNVKAGGTAITLDTADRMIFLSETRIPDQQLQAEDRIHRVSNPRHCMYYYLRSLGTVDVGTALVNQEMIHDNHRLLDGRRGVEYMRHVLELSDWQGSVDSMRSTR